MRISLLPQCRRVVVLLAMACLAPAFCLGALRWDTQKIEITAKSGDKEAVGTFAFVNSGNAPITITSVQPSCGCTTAELAKRTYAPGETGEIKAVFTFGDRVGVQQKIINVTTDEAAGKPLPLMLQVTIPELFTFTPRLLMWRIGDDPGEKSAIISVTETRKITALEIKAIVPAEVSARIEPIEAGTKYQLLVRPNSPAKAVTVTINCVATFADGATHPFSFFALVR